MRARCVHQVGVSVSLNGQQFDLAVEGSHGYRAPPMPTRLTPRAGPASARNHAVSRRRASLAAAWSGLGLGLG